MDSIAKQPRTYCKVCHRPLLCTPSHTGTTAAPATTSTPTLETKTARCLCHALPTRPIQLDTCEVIILQHPLELKKSVWRRSVPLLQLCFGSTVGFTVQSTNHVEGRTTKAEIGTATAPNRSDVNRNQLCVQHDDTVATATTTTTTDSTLNPSIDDNTSNAARRTVKDSTVLHLLKGRRLGPTTLPIESDLGQKWYNGRVPYRRHDYDDCSKNDDSKKDDMMDVGCGDTRRDRPDAIDVDDVDDDDDDDGYRNSTSTVIFCSDNNVDIVYQPVLIFPSIESSNNQIKTKGKTATATAATTGQTAKAVTTIHDVRVDEAGSGCNNHHHDIHYHHDSSSDTIKSRYPVVSLRQLLDEKLPSIWMRHNTNSSHATSRYDDGNNPRFQSTTMVNHDRISKETIPATKLMFLVLDGTWKQAKEMHTSNLQAEQYPSNMWILSLTTSDVEFINQQHHSRHSKMILQAAENQHVESSKATKYGDNVDNQSINSPVDLQDQERRTSSACGPTQQRHHHDDPLIKHAYSQQQLDHQHHNHINPYPQDGRRQQKDLPTIGGRFNTIRSTPKLAMTTKSKPSIPQSESIMTLPSGSPSSYCTRPVSSSREDKYKQYHGQEKKTEYKLKSQESQDHEENGNRATNWMSTAEAIALILSCVESRYHHIIQCHLIDRDHHIITNTDRHSNHNSMDAVGDGTNTIDFTIYNTIMRPVDEMVRQCESFMNHKNKMKKTTTKGDKMNNLPIGEKTQTRG